MITYKTKNNYIDKQSEFIDEVRMINEDFFYKTGKQKKAFTHSYGCQQNLSDTEKINGQLSAMGFSFTDNREEADFILYNTCAVREGAEDRVFGNVGALKHYKKRNPSLIIGLCGCMTQQEKITTRIKRSYSFVDLIFGTHALHKLPEMVYKTMTENKKIIDIEESKGIVSEGLPIKRDQKYRAWVSIMYGCNNFCTYCIVPYVRGRERSRGSEDIILEIKDLIEKGYKEFHLLGQNVNSYGKNVDNEINFSQLLEKINNLDGDFRIRFMTSHPKDATKELIDTIKKCKKIERHIHLPVQSGSNKILRKMNRGYTVESYKEIVTYAKELMPEITFSTDIIVGFPGETKEDFLKTMDLIKEMRFLNIYNYLYSKRSGTKAVEYEDVILKEEKTLWLSELIKEQKKIGREVLGESVNKTSRVLVENKGKKDGFLSGKNDSNTICEFLGDENLIGSIVNINVKSVANWAATGDLIEKAIK